jgi:hypothetical protein
MKKIITFLMIVVWLVLLIPIACKKSANADQQEFGIQLGTYMGRTSQWWNDSRLITNIEFSSNNRIEMWDVLEPVWEKINVKSGQYSTSNENGLDFITISWSTGTQEKFLYLTSEEGFVYLYNSDSAPYFDDWGGVGKVFGDASWIKASSSFQEMSRGKTVIYSPDKLGIKIGECWVPNKELNEQLMLSFPPRTFGLYISSGFVSFSKPYLYRENSRMKKIRLYNSSGYSKIVELKDTPHFQEVSIDDFPYGTILNIEILEVYPGTKYSDTCVNAIFCNAYIGGDAM